MPPPLRPPVADVGGFSWSSVLPHPSPLGAGEPLPRVNNTLPTPLPHPISQTGLAPAPSRDSFLPPPTRLPSMPVIPPAVGLPGSWPLPAPTSAQVGMPMPLRSPLSTGMHRGVGLPKLGVFSPPPAASAASASEALPVPLPTGPSMAYAHRQPPVMTPAAPPTGHNPLGSRSSLPLPLPMSNLEASAAAPSPVIVGHPLMRPPAAHSLNRPVEGARPIEDRRPSARADSRVDAPASSRPRVPDKALPVVAAVTPPRRSVALRSEAEQRRDLGAKEAIKAAKKRDHRPPMPARASHGQAGVAMASADPGRKGGSPRARTPLGAAAVADAPAAPAALPPRPPASAGTSADPIVDGPKPTDAPPAVTTPSPTVPRKPRKPYTITKARECWSAEEHHRFLRALELYSRDWKRIEAHVRTKTVLQIRSHAQKHFYKVQKNKTGEYVPPARIKRRPNSISAGTSMPASGAASGAGNDSVPVAGCSTSSYGATAVTGDAGLARTGGSRPNERTRGRGAIGSGASGGAAAATAAAATAAASATDPASGTAAEGHSGEGRLCGDSGTDQTRNAAGRQLSSSGDDGGSGRSNNSQTYQPDKEGGPAAGSGAIVVNAAAKAGAQPGGVVNVAGNSVANGADATVDPFVAGAAAAAAAAAATTTASASAPGSIPLPFGPYSHVSGVPSTVMAGALSAHSAWLAATQAQQGMTPPAMPGVAPHLCAPPMYGAGGPNMYFMPPPWMPSYPPPSGPSGGGFPMYPMAWPQYYPHPAMAAVMATAAYGSARTPGLPLPSGGVGVSASAQAPFVNDNPAASQLGASAAGPVGAPDLSQQPLVDRGAAAVVLAGAQALKLDAAPVRPLVEAGDLANGTANGFPVGVPAEGWATAAASRRAHRARVLRSVKSRVAAAGGGADEALEPSVPAQDAGASAHGGGAGRRPRGPMPSAGAYYGTGAAAGATGATSREAAVAAAAQRSAAAAADDSGRDAMDGIGSGTGSGGDSLIGSHTSVEAAPGGSDDTAQGGRDDPPSDGVFGRSSSPPSAVAPPRSSSPVDGQPSSLPLGTGSPDILARAVRGARHDHGSDGSASPGGRAGQSSGGLRGGGSSDPASGGSTYAGSSRGNSRELASPGIGGPRPRAGPGAPRGGGGGSGSDDVGAGVCGGSVGGSGGGTPPDGSEVGSPLCSKRPREAGADGACGGAARRPPLSPHFHKPHAGARPDARRDRLAISWAALQQERDKADAALGRPVPAVPSEAEHVPDSQLPTGALPYQLEDRCAMR